MEAEKANGNREKKMSRKEMLEKKKLVEEIIKAASSEKDHLSCFPTFRQCHRNGLSVYLESGHGNNLSSQLKQYIQCLLKENMKGPYGSEWPAEEKVKRREMIAPEARYIFAYEIPTADARQMPAVRDKDRDTANRMDDKGPIIGFVHYRFLIEEEIPVLYVYELQLEQRVQGKGLGEYLMQLIELIGHKSKMGAVVLTVQKANILAMKFYTSKLRLGRNKHS
ncbi:PREDICTED: N-alpha-acetyltransferase 40 isoform X4 [Ipomoea nil]|uniref:N-alpha-acetyltransferase 40 isoform X4 n=1 Tax=Ipomoea nil TaxID=35883 RepID=UPI000900C57E|nr:PREDICTED: N-alpha-acetyltransferase 40 isoform X4 [Ipomoea nil]